MLARDFVGEVRTRGEIVIVVAPPQHPIETTITDLDALLRAALDRVSLKEAVAEIVAITGEPRRAIYQRALALRAGGEGDNGA
jgi:16S rRNA (cytidine1402-2'-O)-methyltransferase